MGIKKMKGWLIPFFAVLPLAALAAPGAVPDGAPEQEAEEQARQTGEEQTGEEQTGEDQTGEEQEAEEGEEPGPAARFTDQVVVSASRVEQEIVNAPAAVTVIGAEQLEARSATGYAEVLRQAAGVNVSRMTNSSYTVTSRSSSVTGARHQLVLVDGRPVHQEYGSVAWSMLSSDIAAQSAAMPRLRWSKPSPTLGVGGGQPHRAA